MITVYIDVLFLVNFMINILIIEGTGIIMCADTKWYRSLSAAFVGAMYAVVVFFLGMKLAGSIAMKIALSALMVWIAFGFKKRLYFLKLWGSFYLASFIFGGSIIALMSTTGLGSRLGAVYSNGEVYLNLPWQWVFISAVGTYALVAFFGRIRKRHISREAAMRELTIYIKGRKAQAKAIIDTGNSLFDPITGAPVIVCEHSMLKHIVPEGDALMEKMSDAGFKVRFIPFSSIGKEEGVMPGFIPDRVKIDGLEAKDCIIGITKSTLSETAEYHALLNPSAMVE